ncbi:MAG: tetratricopeptide repeat protein, partial [Magnetococcales bacterium]|nr:tetratricopeptide repeat protein [Magnetococcales bacterium]
LGSLLKNHTDRYDEAEKAYRTAIELDPKSAHPWNGLGCLFLSLNRLQESEEAFEQAIKLDPTLIDPFLNSAEKALVAENFDQAASRLIKSRPLLKTDIEKRNQIMLELALALAENNPQSVTQAHEKLGELAGVNLPRSLWNYNDLEPFIIRLPEPEQNLLRAWIAAVKHEEGADPQGAFLAWGEARSGLEE